MKRTNKLAIRVRGVSKAFDLGKKFYGSQSVPVLDRLSFSMGKGEFVGIIGPNGCGKSTLLRIILGIIPPDTGEVTILGKTPVSARIGYVPQHATGSLYPWLTAMENVAFAHSLNNPNRFQAARETLSEFGLESYSQAYPYQLSGGTKQLVSLARATQFSDVLLFDEPLNGLDYQNRQLLEQRMLNMRNGRETVLLVSHDIESTVLLCDRLLVLSSKPTRIKAELPVPLPSKRSPIMRFSPEFGSFLNTVYNVVNA